MDNTLSVLLYIFLYVICGILTMLYHIKDITSTWQEDEKIIVWCSCIITWPLVIVFDILRIFIGNNTL